MILQAAKDMNLDLRQCWTVGDAMRDVEAGKTAGTQTILLTTHPLDATAPVRPDFTARNLVEAARIIAQQPRVGREATAEPKAAKPVPAPQPPSPLGDKHAAVAHELPEPPPTPLADDATEDEATEELNTLADTSAPPVSAAKVAVDESARPRPSSDTESRGLEDPPTATPDQPPAPEPVSTRQESPSTPSDVTTHELLSQIVRELKRQRADFGDFSWPRLTAVLVQMITAGCVIFALFNLGREGFYDWMLGAIVGELVVIASLLAAGRR
jgi:hypothetical protein